MLSFLAENGNTKINVAIERVWHFNSEVLCTGGITFTGTFVYITD